MLSFDGSIEFPPHSTPASRMDLRAAWSDSTPDAMEAHTNPAVVSLEFILFDRLFSSVERVHSLGTIKLI